MKLLFLTLAVMVSFFAYSQENKTVTLVVSGQGSSKDEAKQNALRSAIEQAFGTFISSKTEILNDDLVKDEIVSVANGNIQKFEIISEVQIPDGNYATTLNATVSVSKLISFVESKGGKVEFKGGLFATNILMQEMYEKNEPEALDNVLNTLKQISYKSFDYKINASDPISNNGQWIIPLKIDVFVNSNFFNIPNILEQTIQSLSLSLDDYNNYIKLNKPIYPISLATLNSNETYYLRNINSIELVVDFIYSLNNSITRFSIDNGITRNTLSDYSPTRLYYNDLPMHVTNAMGPGNWAGSDTKGSYVYKESKNGIIKINDENFRIILTGKCGTCAESIFNYCGSRGDNNMPIFNYKELYDFEEYFDTQAYSVKAPCWNVEDPSFYNRLENKEFKAFLPFFIDRKRITKNKELKDQNLGLVISFTSIKPNISILNFEILDLKSLDQIKKVSEYKIVNEN
jgi:hypothetical protein